MLLLSAVLLVGLLGTDGIDRTQEARVAVTAREMVEGGIEKWIIPHCNGEVRLRKPPLAYWLSATSFEIFGVSEFAARLPMALAAVGSIAVAGGLAARFFSERCAFFVTCVLPSLMLFARNGRLAETDILVTFFVTAAIGCFAAMFARQGNLPPSEALGFLRGLGEGTLCHLAAVLLALAVLAKGPPGLYPILFLLAFSLVVWDGEALRRVILSGAPLTFLLVALPWFIVAAKHPDFGQAADDLRNSAAGGGGHSRWFWSYFPNMLVGTAPWTGIAVLAGIEAARLRKSSRTLDFLILWILCIFLPLCLWGNKQSHYLLPLAPPTAILVGWMCDRGVSLAATTGKREPFTIVLSSTVIALGVGGAGLPIAGLVARASASLPRETRPIDFALGTMIVIASSVTMWCWRRRGIESAIAVFAGSACCLMPALVALWSPTLEPPSHKEIAERIRSELGAGPFIFISREQSLSVAFALRTIIPTPVEDEDLETRPEVVAIAIDNVDAKRPTTRPASIKSIEVLRGDETVRAFLVRPGRVLTAGTQDFEGP